MKRPASLKKIMSHALLWAVYIAWAQWQVWLKGVEEVQFITNTITYLILISIIYTFAEFLLPRYLKKESITQFVIYCVAFFFFCFGLIYFNEVYLASVVYNLKIEKVPLSLALNSFSWQFIKYLAAGLAFYYHKEVVSKERQRHEAQKSQLEKEKLAFELAFLRAQINPHFLQNTLNALHGRIEEIDEAGGDCLERLVALMRYTLKTNESNGLADADDELEQVQNLIAIHRFVYPDAQIEYSEWGETGGSIPAHALLTLVENALRHGRLNLPGQPLRIKAEGLPDGRLAFSISNPKNDHPSPGTGLGLQNLRKRLDAQFKNNYTLAEENKTNTYSIQLTITV